MASRPPDWKLNVFGSDRLKARSADELIGLAKGIIADGQVNEAEAEYLLAWLAANHETAHDAAVGRLYERVMEMMQDGQFDAEERATLLETLTAFGSKRIEPGESMRPTDIPLNTPPPILGFAGWRYCFTGTFNFGKRDECEAAVVSRGAAAGSLTKQTDCLVIGHYITDSWLHSTYGLKILKAVEMQNAGHHISIVNEDHWATHL